MKSKLLFLILTFPLLFLSIQSYSQDDMDKGFKFGLTYSSLKSDNLESSPLPGFTLGYAYVTIFGQRSGLIVEYSLTNQRMAIDGWEFDDQNYTISDVDQYNFSMTSLDLVVLYEYYIKDPDLSLVVGPSLSLYNIAGYKDNQEGVISSNVLYNTNNFSSNSFDYYSNSISQLKEDLNATQDFSLLIGAAYGTDELRLNLRYNLGLTNFIKIGDSIDIKAKTNFVEVSMSYYFL